MMSLVIEQDVCALGIDEDFGWYNEDSKCLPSSKSDSECRESRGEVKYLNNFVCTDQWDADWSRDNVLLGTFRSKISCRKNQCTVDTGPLRKLNYGLLSDLRDEVLCATQARFPVPCRKYIHYNTEIPVPEGTSVASEIIINPPTATFYSYKRAPRSLRRSKLETALVIVLKNGSLQLNFDSGLTMEVPVKRTIKKMWALDVGILIEVSGPLASEEAKYYTIVHPLNGFQIFNLENASISWNSDKTLGGYKTYFDSRVRKTSVCNNYFSDWKIVKVETPSFEFVSSRSNRIILAFNQIQKKYKIFSYIYTWESHDRYNTACLAWLRRPNSVHETYNYFAEVTSANCLPVSLSCNMENFPDELVKCPRSIFITSDNNFCPLIWFLRKKANTPYELCKQGLKKIYKRMSTDGSMYPSSVKELLGFKLCGTDTSFGNNNCNHEWKQVLNMDIIDASEMHCTSIDRFDILIIISGHKAALWTGYNDLIPCSIPCLANPFSIIDKNYVISGNDYTVENIPLHISSKKMRMRSSDIFPNNSINSFKCSKFVNNGALNKSELHFDVVCGSKARISLNNKNTRTVDICVDLRIRSALVKSCFEVMSMSDTRLCQVFTKELNKRYLFIRFGGGSEILTEWEDYLAAFISIMYDFGYTLVLKNELENSTTVHPPMHNSMGDKRNKPFQNFSKVIQCFIDRQYSINNIEVIYLGSKCSPSLQRLENISKKGINTISKKLTSYKMQMNSEDFLGALKELQPYIHQLFQSLKIRTFNKNNCAMLSELTTIISYIINRPDLVTYYSTVSNIVFPFDVVAQGAPLNHPILDTPKRNPIDIFNWACDIIKAKHSSEIENIAKMPYPDSLWLEAALHPEKLNFDTKDVSMQIPEKLRNLHTICALLNMKNLLTESPTSAVDTLFHLLKSDMIAEKFNTLHPGFVYFIICIKEQLKLMNLEPADHSLYSVIGRNDLALNKVTLQNRGSVSELLPKINIGIKEYNPSTMLPTSHLADNRDDGIYPLTTSRIVQAIFPKDKRIHEVRKLLQSRYPTYLTSMDLSDIKFAMESDADWSMLNGHLGTLLCLAQRTLALPVGRAAFTLGTVVPISVKKIPIPALVVSANLPPTNAVMTLDSSKTDKGFFYWPKFHNGVAAGLSISPYWKTLDSSWIVYNRDTNQQIEAECLESQHAGFLFGLGLTGRLKMMDIVDLVEYMNNNEGFIAVGLIIGLAASYISTKDEKLTRLCNLHIEPNIPKQFDSSCENIIKPSAVLSLGLLYMECPERAYIITVLNLFKSSVKSDKADVTEAQRNSLTLSCGFALGYMLLGKMGSHEARCVSSLGITDMLIEYILDSSMGSIVSLSSILAIGLMYLKTNNKIMADRMDILSGNPVCSNSHKDVILYTVFCRNLIMWDNIKPTISWVESNVPYKYKKYLNDIKKNSKSDSIGICYDDTVLYIIAGACFAIGISMAGTYDLEAKETLMYYLKLFLRLHYLKAMNLAERLKKSATKACLNVLLNALSLVLAGSGDVELMRIMRKLHFRRFQEISYGDQLALHLSLGFLFLAGGTCTFRSTNRGVAGLITSLFIIYPDSTTDNFIHLQPLRHFWVLSVENRCLVTRDISSGNICNLDVEVQLESTQKNSCISLRTPCTLPEISVISHLKITSPHTWPVTVSLKDISADNWDSKLNYITVFVKCIAHGWHRDRNKNVTTGRNIIGLLSKGDHLDNNMNCGAFLVPRRSKISCLENCSNLYNNYHTLEYQNYNDTDKSLASNIFKDLSNGVYCLSKTTINVLEYCFSEDRLELVPFLLWIFQKLNNIEREIDVEFVCVMRIISELLDTYESKTFANTIHTPPVKKFLSAVETELELRIRKLDSHVAHLIERSDNIPTNKHNELGCVNILNRAAYIRYRNWPYSLTIDEIRNVYKAKGELYTLEYLAQNYNITEMPIHALRLLCEKHTK